MLTNDLDPALLRVLHELAHTAVTADGLANRLYSQGHVKTCTRVRKAARELALACGHHAAMRTLPGLHDTFSHHWRGEAEDA